MLKLTTSLDELGPVNWWLALCLAAIWVVCYFCVWKGVKSTGKVSCVANQSPSPTRLFLLLLFLTTTKFSVALISVGKIFLQF